MAELRELEASEIGSLGVDFVEVKKGDRIRESGVSLQMGGC